MLFMILIAFSLFLYFIALILKYSGTEKPTFELEFYRDKENIKYPPIIAGYLYNGKIEKQHFIATVLDFVAKGYIKLEKSKDNSDYFFTIIKNIKATKIEITALEIFFNNKLSIGLSQSLNHFQTIMKNEKIFGNYNLMKRYFSTSIRNYFNYSQEVKKITDSTNKKNMFLCYIIFLITCFAFVLATDNIFPNPLILVCFSSIAFLIFLFILFIVKTTLLGGFSWTYSIVAICLIAPIFFLLLSISDIYGFWLLIIILHMAVIILFDDMMQRSKTSLANTYQMVKGLKNYINEYSNISEQDICNVYLWDEYYAYAVAFDIKKCK